MERSAKKICLLIFLAIVFCFTRTAQAQQTTQKDWGYTGNIAPERWAQLDPGFATCVNGKSQSPINITTQVTPAKTNLVFRYQPTTFFISRTKHNVQVNFPLNANESIFVDGEEYKLVAMHIHAPSEHLWHGRDFPLEVHLVHRNAQGKLLFVSVFAQGGDELPDLTKILAKLSSSTVRPISLLQINPANFLPLQRSYYSYTGSLTTPPCLEGMRWIVFANPIFVAPAQIVRFKQTIGGVNARPVQPLNGRKIFYST